jgi:SAM-dependent methyltransferase
MENSFWDNRYREHETVYGRKPNHYFKTFIDAHKPGRLLLPAEGEGRNALYAARRGWHVDAFDYSVVAREKALRQAAEQQLSINYTLSRAEDFTNSPDSYDAIGLIYVHLPQALRVRFHTQMYRSLKSGGFLIFEGFAKEQLQYGSGGPKDGALLYDAPSICSDFPFLHILSCGQKEIVLNEGPFHQGPASVLQLIGQKI